jgi:hypothetical protein
MLTKLDKVIQGKGVVKGFTYTQLKNDGHIYLFEVTTEGSKFYEVIKAITAAVCLDFANHIYSDTDFKHVYPSDTKWGKLGWTLFTLKEAEKKYKQLVKAFKSKK